MLELILAVTALGMSFLYLHGRRARKQGERALEATLNWCDRRDELLTWLMEGKPRNTEGFQKLIQANIETHRVFLDSHPHIEQPTGWMEQLEKLKVSVS